MERKAFWEESWVTLVRPQLEYASAACILNEILIKMEMAQHRAVRFVLRDYFTPMLFLCIKNTDRTLLSSVDLSQLTSSKV